jgi:hypothetical protein
VECDAASEGVDSGSGSAFKVFKATVKRNASLVAALAISISVFTAQAADPPDRFNPYTGEYNEPTRHPIVVHDRAKPVVHPAQKREVSAGVQVHFVDDKSNADATHIYFGPSNDRSLITSTEMKAEYDANPKAYAQG